MISNTTPDGTGSRGVSATAGSIARLLFFSDAAIAILAFIVFTIYMRPYHNFRDAAAQFDAATNCASVAASATLPGPCSVEWANVVLRYYRSTRAGSRSSPGYAYYLNLRRAYGELESVRIPDQNFWWRASNGSAVKLQRWGTRTTAIAFATGQTTVTTDNPDWYAGRLAAIEASFRVLGGDELQRATTALGRRLVRAAGQSGG